MDQILAVSFDDLADADLLLERVYRGGAAGNSGDDPLAQLLPVGNQGGFRTCGRVVRNAVKLTVWYTSGAEPDWPNALNVHAGTQHGKVQLPEQNRQVAAGRGRARHVPDQAVACGGERSLMGSPTSRLTGTIVVRAVPEKYS